MTSVLRYAVFTQPPGVSQVKVCLQKPCHDFSSQNLHKPGHRNNISFLGTIDKISANLKFSAIFNSVFFSLLEVPWTLLSIKIVFLRHQNEHFRKRIDKYTWKWENNVQFTRHLIYVLPFFNIFWELHFLAPAFFYALAHSVL